MNGRWGGWGIGGKGLKEGTQGRGGTQGRDSREGKKRGLLVCPLHSRGGWRFDPPFSPQTFLALYIPKSPSSPTTDQNNVFEPSNSWLSS